MNKRSNHPAYAAMLAASKATGLPRSFETDLTKHDRAALTHWLPTEPFAWALYDAGTHLVWSRQRHQSKLTSAELCQSVDEIFSGCRWFWWDGRSLTVSSAAEVTERMSEIDESLRQARAE